MRALSSRVRRLVARGEAMVVAEEVGTAAGGSGRWLRIVGFISRGRRSCQNGGKAVTQSYLDY
jgi:hypothetical protein